jgi:hypothetical protein
VIHFSRFLSPVISIVNVVRRWPIAEMEAMDYD